MIFACKNICCIHSIKIGRERGEYLHTEYIPIKTTRIVISGSFKAICSTQVARSSLWMRSIKNTDMSVMCVTCLLSYRNKSTQACYQWPHTDSCELVAALRSHVQASGWGLWRAPVSCQWRGDSTQTSTRRARQHHTGDGKSVSMG